MSEPTGGGNVIVVTLKDVYIELMKIKETLGELKNSADKVPDHETRIRALEKWRYALPPAIILALMSAIVSVLGLLNQH